MRACHHVQVRCERFAVLLRLMDCEATQKSAMEQLLSVQEKPEGLDMAVLCGCPDAVHTAKSMRCSFANWYLFGGSSYFSMTTLRTLRSDPTLAALRRVLPLAAVRNRDRMAVQTVVDISTEKVITIVSAHTIGGSQLSISVTA